MSETKKTSKRTRRTVPQSVRGMRDLLPEELLIHNQVINVFEEIFKAYQFQKIEVPVVEATELYERGSGVTTDIVEKELYAFTTKGKDRVALRPEFTPGVARAYSEHSLGRRGAPQRLFATGPLFRHDRPQAGRYRQFSQISAEVLGGTSDPIYDAQIVAAFSRAFAQLKLKPTLEVNSIGCKDCRPSYLKKLTAYYESHRDELCTDCVRRLETNPLRILDCKNEDCRALLSDAPNILDSLCKQCSQAFREFMEYLEELGVPCALNPYLVRGLDYYTRTVFEFLDPELGALAAGGRYDYLLKTLGAKDEPAVGGACGIDRIVLALQREGKLKEPNEEKRVFVAHAGSAAKKRALAMSDLLVASGLSVRDALSKPSLSAQLKVANKEGIALAVIVGQKEMLERTAIIRDFKTGLQETFPEGKIASEVRDRLRHA